MCARWKNSFENFLADMGPRPSDNHSIDRIDNDGGYKPSNCRWATRVQQARNKRSNVYINYKGKKRNVTEIARLLNIDPMMVHKRIRRGWSNNDLLKPSQNRKHSIIVNGETLSLQAACRELEINHNRVGHYLKKWKKTPEEAIDIVLNKSWPQT
jgi:hypothetical protein